MKDFARSGRPVVAELGPEVEAAGEYLALRERLRTDDLPSFEADFRDLLQREHHPRAGQLQRTARHASAQDRLAHRHASTVALADIDYNPGTLHPPRARERRRTRTCASSARSCAACTEGTLTGRTTRRTPSSEVPAGQGAASSASRPRGHTPSGDQALDAQRVTDVRNWFTFSASERSARGRRGVRALHRLRRQERRAEGEARLHDAGRVAEPTSTAWRGAGTPRSFRFVVIDEAFGRGSDESGAVSAWSCSGGSNLQLLDRHAAAEDPHHRAVRGRGRVRPQRERPQPRCAP